MNSIYNWKTNKQTNKKTSASEHGLGTCDDGKRIRIIPIKKECYESVLTVLAASLTSCFLRDPRDRTTLLPLGILPIPIRNDRMLTVLSTFLASCFLSSCSLFVPEQLCCLWIFYTFQSVELQTGTPRTQVRFPYAAKDFPPRQLSTQNIFLSFARRVDGLLSTRW